MFLIVGRASTLMFLMLNVSLVRVLVKHALTHHQLALVVKQVSSITITAQLNAQINSLISQIPAKLVLLIARLVLVSLFALHV